jgi:predicted short-subunit dehydrogenase-like oxidoreductase (DUF2520 family)
MDPLNNASTPPQESWGELRFGLVGPGKVGTSLALWLEALGARPERLGARRPVVSTSAVLAPTVGIEDFFSDDLDLLLIAVADAALPTVAAQLARRPQAKIVLHVSGFFDAEVLAPLAARASATGTLHPLQAFPTRLDRPTRGTFYALAGAPPAIALGSKLAASWHGTSGVVEGEQRRLYHLAATLAAGGVITVLAAVEELSAAAGLPKGLRSSFLSLTQSALAGVETDKEIAQALTGPAARRDHAMLEAHRAALASVAPGLLPLVETLQREGLARAKKSRIL